MKILGSSRNEKSFKGFTKKAIPIRLYFQDLGLQLANGQRCSSALTIATVVADVLPVRQCGDPSLVLFHTGSAQTVVHSCIVPQGTRRRVWLVPAFSSPRHHGPVGVRQVVVSERSFGQSYVRNRHRGVVRELRVH